MKKFFGFLLTVMMLVHLVSFTVVAESFDVTISKQVVVGDKFVLPSQILTAPSGLSYETIAWDIPEGLDKTAYENSIDTSFISTYKFTGTSQTSKRVEMTVNVVQLLDPAHSENFEGAEYVIGGPVPSVENSFTLDQFAWNNAGSSTNEPGNIKKNTSVEEFVIGKSIKLDYTKEGALASRIKKETRSSSSSTVQRGTSQIYEQRMYIDKGKFYDLFLSSDTGHARTLVQLSFKSSSDGGENGYGLARRDPAIGKNVGSEVLIAPIGTIPNKKWIDLRIVLDTVSRMYDVYLSFDDTKLVYPNLPFVHTLEEDTSSTSGGPADNSIRYFRMGQDTTNLLMYLDDIKYYVENDTRKALKSIKSVPSSLDTMTVQVNENASLPETVAATLSDDTTYNMNVTWNGSVDTSKVGSSTFLGTIKGYPEPVTIEVIVNQDGETENPEEPIVYDLTINKNIVMGDKFILPDKILAEQLTTGYKDITWNIPSKFASKAEYEASINTNKLGKYHFSGVSDGKNVEMLVNVIDCLNTVYAENFDAISDGKVPSVTSLPSEGYAWNNAGTSSGEPGNVAANTSVIANPDGIGNIMKVDYSKAGAISKRIKLETKDNSVLVGNPYIYEQKIKMLQGKNYDLLLSSSSNQGRALAQITIADTTTGNGANGYRLTYRAPTTTSTAGPEMELLPQGAVPSNVWLNLKLVLDSQSKMYDIYLSFTNEDVDYNYVFPNIPFEYTLNDETSISGGPAKNDIKYIRMGQEGTNLIALIDDIKYYVHNENHTAIKYIKEVDTTLSPISANLLETVQLASKTTATLSDGSTILLDIVWDEAVNNTIVGIKTYRGKIIGYPDNVSQVVTINSKPFAVSNPVYTNAKDFSENDKIICTTVPNCLDGIKSMDVGISYLAQADSGITTVCFIVAQYSDKNELLSTTITSKSVVTEGQQNVTLPVVLKEATNSRLAVFTFESFENIRPINKAFVLPEDENIQGLIEVK